MNTCMCSVLNPNYKQHYLQAMLNSYINDVLPSLNRTIFNNIDFRSDKRFGEKADTDGDTLTDLQEITGWTICLYSDNTGKLSKSYTVTSDPTKIDTDNDSATDAQEFGRSDLRKSDTDADNIPDYRDMAPCGTVCP